MVVCSCYYTICEQMYYAKDVQCPVSISGAETKTLSLPTVVACTAAEQKLAKTNYEFAYEYTYQDHEYILSGLINTKHELCPLAPSIQPGGQTTQSLLIVSW